MTSLLTVLPELAVPALDNPKADFTDTPWWLSLIKAVLIFVYLLISTLLVIWFERRVIGRMHQRPGPNRPGPFGLLQTLTDGMKSMLKEDVAPAAADRLIFTLAPLIAATMAFVSFAIIPLGDKASMFGHMTPLQLADFPVAVLLVLAVASVAVYVVTMVGETNRLPFDLAEGEGELTGGFHTEYGSMRFAMFFLAEYINMFTVSALATTMFLGGWQAPPVVSLINDNMFSGGWWGVLWFTAKMWAFMFVFVWLRGSLPRTRYDQFMRFGWKFLIPVTLLWVVLVAFIRGAQNGWFGDNVVTIAGRNFPVPILVAIAVIAIVALGGSWLYDTRRADKEEAEAATGPPNVVDPFAGGYPVPPLPGQTLKERERRPVAVGAP